MTLKNVRRVSKDAGINYAGIKISIDRNPELIGKGYYGYTWPNGKKVTLYPDAFSTKEVLVKTLGHERIHVYQVKTFGEPKTDNMARMFEKAAYGSENDWWKYFKQMNGGK
ncbi:MAG: hypothetical protein HFI34_09785 [Lachnospiraceae bacterium]|nr:hypothetical protein [Lachnospiraceae bacterium]